jgi:NADPH:quinone reductase-like Zn-dependent oxidoreductase
MALTPFTKHLPALSFSMPQKPELMQKLRDLLEAGKLTPVIDKCYPLSEVSEALAYLTQGRAKGRILVPP